MTTKQFLLSEDQIATLSRKLLSIADQITTEMAIACDGQARVAPSLAYTRSQPASRPPYPLGMRDLMDELWNELSTTIRHLEESGLVAHYDGARSDCDMAAWLNSKRYRLALLPDADEVFDGLVKIIDRCTRSVNVGVERKWSQALYDEANRLWYTADQLEKLAPQLGAEGRGLSKNRVNHLARAHGLTSHVDPDSGIARYKLGDVLQKHQSAPRRNRVKKAS